jgi:hypothetical protein
MAHRKLAVLGFVAFPVLLAGCGGAGSVATTTTTLAPTTSTTSPPTTTTTSATTAASGCVLSQLAITSSSNAGLGHIGAILVFTNASQVTCTLQGYPGVAMLNAQGDQVVQAIRTPSGYLGGIQPGTSPPLVTLKPGAAASATLEGDDVPTGTATTCPTYPKILVTPPNATQSATLPVSMPGCSPVQIHPVVPGSSGSLGL